ncbi:MAG: NAD-dependent epimerase/dehydratase family protein [bacterium]
MINHIIKDDLEIIISHKLDWSKFDDSLVLITGANSYIAAYILETLLYLNDKYDKKIKVVALARDKEKALKKYSHHQGRKDLEFIFQDVCQPIKIKEPINFIVHAASQSSPKYYEHDPVGTLCANTIGTINLLKITNKNDLKGFLFLSTGGVYGEVKANQLPTKENNYGYIDPTDVMSCYNESKRMGENICVCWSHQYGIPTKIARISWVYGPGMDLNDERVVSSFVSDILNKRDIIIKSDGRATRSFCYIADATKAFFTLLLNGANGGAYNVGVEKETSIYELAKIIVAQSPKNGIKIIRKHGHRSLYHQQHVFKRSCLAITKIKKLGWKPQININDGIKRTIQSYCNDE